jgi:hypothetical protein
MADYKDAREWDENDLKRERLGRQDAGTHLIADLNRMDSNRGSTNFGKVGKDYVDPEKVKAGGYKADEGKLRYDLIPPDALDELARVYTIGATKYDDRNWEVGMKFGRVFAAMMRHAWRWWAGETNDPKDGQHHLSSVAWAALALLHYDLNRQKYETFDDRPEPTLVDNRVEVMNSG